jgi:hypothetical protein
LERNQYLNSDLEPEMAQGIAEGNLNPITYKRFEKETSAFVVRKKPNQIPKVTKKYTPLIHDQIFMTMKRKQPDTKNNFPLTTKVPTNNIINSDKKVKMKLASIQELKSLTNINDAKEASAQVILKPATKPSTQMKFTYFKGSRLSDFAKPKLSPYFDTNK